MRFLALGVMAAIPLAAQTTSDKAPPADPSSAWAREEAIGFLPKTDQARVIAAHDKALADDPALKKEDDALRVEGKHFAEADSLDRIAFTEKSRTHEQKIRQAMLKEDPTLGPLLAQIDKHISTLRAQRQTEADSPQPPP